VRAALLVREVLTDLGLSGVVKTSGAKGVPCSSVDSAFSLE